jgi:Putative Flp pilus-assembly TadE/G-like
MILTALMAVVILGAAAIAVDLGVNTFSQRTLQNVSDAAALAGATDLGGQPTSAQQQQGITDALLTVQKNENFPAGWTGASTETTCGTGYCETVTYGNYTVNISTPPLAARAAVNGTTNDFEADLHFSVHNGFGAVIGAPTSTIAAHSVAYHSGPAAPYSFAFFARVLTESGNNPEMIYGDAFVGNGYSPQSKGQAGLCIYEVAGGTQGHVVFGTVPPSTGPEPSYGVAPGTPPSCASKGALSAQAPSPQAAAPTNCPLPSTPYQDTTTSPSTWLCYLNPAVPSVAEPTVGQGMGTTLACNATVNSSTPAGVYGVPANCAVTLDFSNISVNNGDISCVSLVLGAGSSVSINDKKGQDYITSYGFNPTGDTVADTDISNLVNTIGKTVVHTSVPTLACPGAGKNADNAVIWAPATTTSPMPVVLSNSSKGCCSDTLFVGSIFLLGQEVNFNSNQALEDAGSIYCGDWQVQSGNHPNPVVSYDAGATAFVAEVLRLVE